MFRIDPFLYGKKEMDRVYTIIYNIQMLLSDRKITYYKEEEEKHDMIT